MSETRELPPLRDVIARAGLLADKRLGQHFLLDLNLTARIARSVANLGEGTTIEVGPGPGGLTRALLEAGAQVVTIEKDPRCRSIIAELADAYPGRLTAMEGDALTIDAAALGAGPRRIVSNLPYNVGTELLIRWLEKATAFESFTLMFQTEVANRLVAPANTGAYGRLSVLAQWLCDVKKIYDLPPSAFTPPPKVSSAVVHFTPKTLDKNAPSFEAVEAVTAAAFGQRRKMIRSSLKNYADKFKTIGINDENRAENLTVKNFIDLAI